jgi:hypothetical protein
LPSSRPSAAGLSRERGQPAAATLFIGSFAMSVVSGMLYKIVPWLA